MDHLTSAEFAINNIALGRMKVARFSDLNDPFELMALNLRELSTRKVVIDFKNTEDSHTGLLCFSANWTSPVLWSHYGAKHCGICLGFDIEKGRAEKVQYEDERIREKLGEEGDPLVLDKKLQDLLLRTKYSHWNYEEEYRVFVPGNSVTAQTVMALYLPPERLRSACGPVALQTLPRPGILRGLVVV